MKPSILLFATLSSFALLPVTAGAADFKLGTVDARKLGIQGSSCELGPNDNTIYLVSDWHNKYWIRIDGKLILLTSRKTEAQDERDRAAGRLRETLQQDDVTVVLDLKKNGSGEDVIGYGGHLDVSKGAGKKRIVVDGQCSA